MPTLMPTWQQGIEVDDKTSVDAKVRNIAEGCWVQGALVDVSDIQQHLEGFQARNASWDR